MSRQKNAQPRREAMGGLGKGLAVIRAFTRDHAALSLSDIARSAGIPAATARRCLLTLEELGYVKRNGRDFLLRPKVLELGAAYLESMNIEHLTRTHLEELARNTTDSAALCVLDGADIVYVARAHASRRADSGTSRPIFRHRAAGSIDGPDGHQPRQVAPVD